MSQVLRFTFYLEFPTKLRNTENPINQENCGTRNSRIRKFRETVKFFGEEF